MKYLPLFLLLILVSYNSISCSVVKHDSVTIKGKTFNSKFFKEPLIIGNDGYLYVIASKRSSDINKYIIVSENISSWKDLYVDKMIKFKAIQITDKGKAIPDSRDYLKWKVGVGDGYPVIREYPPVEGTFKIVQLISFPN